MKIGIVCYPTFGGSGVIATELGMGLAKKGHEVHFITYNLPVKLDFISSGLHFHEVRIEEYPLFQYQPYELALSSKMVSVASRYKLEVLHVHYAIPHAYAAYMAKQMLLQQNIPIKIVTTLHGTDITLVGSHPNYKTSVEFSINNSDVVTAVSNSLKNDTLRLFDIQKDIHVIHNFIDIQKYEAIENEKCQRASIAKEDEKIVVHISNFRPVKRIGDVVTIFHAIQQKISSKLIMVGDGPDVEYANQKIKELGLHDKVLFLGNSTEVDKILCYADLFLLPSETESFGLTILEAMAAKTAIISTNTGGLPEVNIEGETGFLSAVGAVDQMANNAIQLLENDQLLKQFKENSYKHAKKFGIEQVIEAYEKIYN